MHQLEKYTMLLKVAVRPRMQIIDAGPGSRDRKTGFSFSFSNAGMEESELSRAQPHAYLRHTRWSLKSVACILRGTAALASLLLSSATVG